MSHSSCIWRAAVLGLSLSSLAASGCGGGEGGETEVSGSTTAPAADPSTAADTSAGSSGEATAGATGTGDATGSGEAPTTGTPTTGSTDAPSDTSTGEPLGPCEKPWPDATNTGIPAGTPALTVLEGDFHTEQDGQVFDAVEIRGRLYVDHEDIVITRSLLVGDQYYALYATETASGLTIEDSEVVGGVLLPDHTTVRRTRAHAAEDGLRDDGFIFSASHVLLEDNRIDGLRGGDGAHIDGIQTMGGTDIVLRHNWIDPSSPPVADGGVNAAIFINPGDGVPSADVTVECNMILGGGSWYPLRLYGTGGEVIVRGNRFDRDFLGVPVHTEDTVVSLWEDNAFADDGEVIPPP